MSLLWPQKVFPHFHHFSFSIQLSTLFKHLVRLPLKRFQIVVKIEGNLLLVLLKYENNLKMSCRTLWCCCESVASILCSPYAPIDKEGRHGSVRITKKRFFVFQCACISKDTMWLKLESLQTTETSVIVNQWPLTLQCEPCLQSTARESKSRNTMDCVSVPLYESVYEGAAFLQCVTVPSWIQHEKEGRKCWEQQKLYTEHKSRKRWIFIFLD